MLSRQAFAFLSLSASIVAAAGCVITTSPTSGTTTGATETTGVTTGATTGAGGGTTGAGVGGGTTGAGGGCVGETGAGTVADCDTMNITPDNHGGPAAISCGPNTDQEPPGYGLCTRAFTLFTVGSATDLQQCLATIGVQDECQEPPLQVCVDRMYADACIADAVQAQCDTIKTMCAADPFDAVQCGKDLNPFSDAGLQELIDCFNGADPAKSCQTAYDECYTQVLTF